MDWSGLGSVMMQSKDSLRWRRSVSSSKNIKNATKPTSRKMIVVPTVGDVSLGNTHNVRRFVLWDVPRVGFVSRRRWNEVLLRLWWLLIIILVVKVLLQLLWLRITLISILNLWTTFIHQRLVIIILRLILIVLLLVLIGINRRRIHRHFYLRKFIQVYILFLRFLGIIK